MPLYEYYCEHCVGIFEAIRPMREATEAWPCPVCDRDGQRIMPTSFSAFTFREGYPRRLPDKGTYWHLGKEVKSRIRSGLRPYEHQELLEPKRPRKIAKGDQEVAREKDRLRMKELKKMRDSGVAPSEQKLPKPLRKK